MIWKVPSRLAATVWKEVTAALTVCSLSWPRQVMTTPDSELVTFQYSTWAYPPTRARPLADKESIQRTSVARLDRAPQSPGVFLGSISLRARRGPALV